MSWRRVRRWRRSCERGSIFFTAENKRSRGFAEVLIDFNELDGDGVEESCMFKKVDILHIKTTIMAIPDFPNGFESWQKTHFEVVEVLCFMRDLEPDMQPKNFTELVDQSATQELYDLALNLTNKYEAQSKGKERERSLFDEIEEFVWTEVKNHTV